MVSGDAKRQHRVMVFCNTLDSCRATEHFLSEAGLPTLSYHGERARPLPVPCCFIDTWSSRVTCAAAPCERTIGLSRDQPAVMPACAHVYLCSSGDVPLDGRRKAIAQFAEGGDDGQQPLLICTDLAARCGIDPFHDPCRRRSNLSSLGMSDAFD